MEEVKRLRALISSMDIKALQQEADRINKVMPLRIDMIREYYKKAKGIRIGDYFTETKRNTCKLLKRRGLKHVEIAEVMSINHCLVSYYLNNMATNNGVSPYVKDNFVSWIKDGLYPTSTNVWRHNVKTRKCLLTSDPSLRRNNSNPRDIIHEDLFDDFLLD
jgi:hypothetical protein